MSETFWHISGTRLIFENLKIIPSKVNKSIRLSRKLQKNLRLLRKLQKKFAKTGINDYILSFSDHI